MPTREGNFASPWERKQSSRLARLFGKEGAVRRLLPIILFACAALLLCACASAQQVPLATDLPAHPFFIKSTWYIGGAGTWDYMTFDRDANRLYIAHGTVMQVVDVDTGSKVGEIRDLYEARQVALDDTGQYGYVSDGGQGKVVVFDRQTLKRVVDIDTGANPRWIVFDPLTHLVFVVRANPPGEAPPGPPPTAHRRNTGLGEPPPPPATATAPKPPAQQQESNIQSFVTVIDGQTQTALGEIKLTGQVGYAVVDEGGQLFIALPDRNQVARIDTAAIANVLRPPPQPENPVSATAETPAADPSATGTGAERSFKTEAAAVYYARLDGHSSQPRDFRRTAAHLSDRTGLQRAARSCD